MISSSSCPPTGPLCFLPQPWLVPSLPLPSLAFRFSCPSCPCFTPLSGLAGAGALPAAVVRARAWGWRPGRAVVHLLSVSVWTSTDLVGVTWHPVCARSPRAVGRWPCSQLSAIALATTADTTDCAVSHSAVDESVGLCGAGCRHLLTFWGTALWRGGVLRPLSRGPVPKGESLASLMAASSQATALLMAVETMAFTASSVSWAGAAGLCLDEC